MQPWAEALVKQRKDGFGKDDPTARCQPLPPARAWSAFLNQKIIQTPESLTILDEYMAQDPTDFSGRPSASDRSRPLLQGVFGRQVGG